MVRRFYKNPILKGMPARGFRHTVKHNETGRRISVKNSSDPTYRECPHLAHVDPADFDEVNAELTKKHGRAARKPVGGVDPRWQVPRKRTRFPGQHAICWYCGRQYVWGANGITGHLMCTGSREWQCWNSIGIDGGLTAEKLVEAVTAELYRLDGVDDQFARMVRAAREDRSDGSQARREQLQREEESLAREQEKFQAAIAAYGPRPLLEEKLLELEDRERKLAHERQRLEVAKRRELQLPASVGEMRNLLEEEFVRLTTCSHAFGDLMRRLVPEIHVYLVRLCDGGHLLPRARVVLDLTGIVPDMQLVPGLGGLLTRELTLDLFRPPQRERIREDVVALTAAGLTQRQIAARLDEKPTQTAVQKAVALDRRMREAGLEGPCVMLREPPEDYRKLRRHRNSKYRFEPLSGYSPPSI